jgi:hypothetical protein
MEDLGIFFVLWGIVPILVANMKIKWNWYFLLPILLTVALILSGISFLLDKIDLIIVSFGMLFGWIGVYSSLQSEGKKILYGFLIIVGFFIYPFIPNKMSVGIQSLDKEYSHDTYTIKARTYEGTSARSGTDMAVSKRIGAIAIFERQVLLASDFSSSYIAYGATPIVSYNGDKNELYVEAFNGYAIGRIDTFSKSNNFYKLY